MIFAAILASLVLVAEVLHGVDASCDSNELDKCADIVAFLSTRQTEVVGPKMLKEACRFIRENVTSCATDVITRCSNLNDERYKTLLRVKSRIEDEMCKDGSDPEKELMKHESCLKTITEDDAMKCVQDLAVVMQMLKESDDKDICCSISNTKSCIHELVLSRCGNEAANATSRITDLLVAPLTDPRCDDFKDVSCRSPGGSSSSLTPAVLLLFAINFMLIIAH